jgi:hypothetical protein
MTGLCDPQFPFSSGRQFVRQFAALRGQGFYRADQPGFGIARECRQRTAPTEIKHHESHSGG